MEYIELTETFFPDSRYTWTPLEASDSTEKVLQDFHKTTAEDEGWNKYEQDTAEYERAMSQPQHTAERQSAIDALKRLMGRG